MQTPTRTPHDARASAPRLIERYRERGAYAISAIRLTATDLGLTEEATATAALATTEWPAAAALATTPADAELRLAAQLILDGTAREAAGA